MGSIGGQLQQIYYIIDEIFRRYPDGLRTYLEKKVDGADIDYLSRANNIRELMLKDHLYPFLMQYIKKMENEALCLSLHPVCAKWLNQVDCPHDDLS